VREIDRRADELAALVARAHRCAAATVDAAIADLAHTTARIRALSPAATLERGYAIVQRADGAVVREAAAVDVGEPLGVRLAAGRLSVTVTDREI
jgi:exodeoxyribonuclease VII large subunit